jgi:antitoxin MazE
MKTNIIRIGNARGIRIPKMLLEQCQLRDEVEIEVQDNHLIIRPVVKPRSEWAEAFRRMHEQGDDVLLDKESLPATQWDKTEWEW